MFFSRALSPVARRSGSEGVANEQAPDLGPSSHQVALFKEVTNTCVASDTPISTVQVNNHSAASAWSVDRSLTPLQ